MAATRLLMRRLRELLRLKYEVGLPHRAIAQACAVGLGTVSEYLARATAAGVAWPASDRQRLAVSPRPKHPAEAAVAWVVV